MARNVINANKSLDRLLQPGREQLEFLAAERARHWLAAAAAEGRPPPTDALTKLWLAETIRESPSEEPRRMLAQLQRQMAESERRASPTEGDKAEDGRRRPRCKRRGRWGRRRQG